MEASTLRKDLIICAIVFLILISSGCIETKTPEKPSKLDIISSCEQRARELIPKTIVIQGGERMFVATEQWNDGSKIEGSLFFHRGSSSEEKSHYLYSDEILGEKIPMAYSKQIISDNGTILGTRTFGINPILAPFEEDKDPREGIINQKHRFVKINFIECEWVTDEY